MGSSNRPEAFIYEAVRTPRGKGKPGGALYGTLPVNLVIGLVREMLRRHPGLDPGRIDDVVLGTVTQVREQGGVLARDAAVHAGLPHTVAGVQLNRYCASGLEAVNMAAQKVRSGWEDLILAGGVESMSRLPMGSDPGPIGVDPLHTYQASFVPQGISADLIATIEGYTRDQVDSWGAESQARATNAWEKGYFSRSVVPVVDQNGLTVLDRDEAIRPETTVESLASLKPTFEQLGRDGGFDAVALQKYHWVERIDHVHHAGNSSGIVDGASLLVIGNEQVGTDLGLRPRARIVTGVVTGEEPTIMLTGPGPAARKALRRTGLTVADIDLFEINEAFASVVLRFMKDLDLEPDRVNVNGGAIAMGHPLGATGGMILGTLLDELERQDLRRGLAALCVGGGMGIATIIERV
jgi:acetyl-CoA C-acetyltransferase